jgi:hypothetical protein
VIKWIHAYWLVILVSSVLAIAVNQLIFAWREQRRHGRGERTRRDLVFRKLLADLRPHCESLQQVLLAPTIDVNRWQQSNDDLQKQAREPESVTALGAYYDPYLYALAAEARAILALRRSAPNARATVENVADVLVALAPFVRTFGDPRCARELESAARKSYDYAKTVG